MYVYELRAAGATLMRSESPQSVATMAERLRKRGHEPSIERIEIIERRHAIELSELAELVSLEALHG